MSSIFLLILLVVIFSHHLIISCFAAFNECNEKAVRGKVRRILPRRLWLSVFEQLPFFLCDGMKHDTVKWDRKSLLLALGDALILPLSLIETCCHGLRRATEIKTCPPPSSETSSAGYAVTGMTQSIHKAYDSVQWQYASHSLWVYTQFPSDTLDPIILAVFGFSTDHCSQLTVTYISCRDRWAHSCIGASGLFIFSTTLIVSLSLKLKLPVFAPVTSLTLAIPTAQPGNKRQLTPKC